MQDMQFQSLDVPVTIYNLGPYARSSFLRAQRRTATTRRRITTGLGYLDDYFNSTFGEQRFTRILEYTIRGDFSKEESARIAGDPLQHDVIVSFGNESVHWYAIVIDNRLGQRKIVYYDSGGYNKRSMIARCNFHLQFVNDFRSRYLRGVLGMQLEDTHINCQTHPIMDGLSLKQSNAYDCGVFALANVERYLNHTNFPPVSQSLMKLYRCRYLSKLYDLARDLDLRR